MRRITFQAALLTGILTVVSLPSADAQEGRARIVRGQSPQRGYVRPAGYAPPKKIIINPHQGGAPAAIDRSAAAGRIPSQPGYVYLNAPLYPVPRPDIPYQVGSSFITNQALSSHEMLYPHTYRALYPPFYYYVQGHWVKVKDCMKTHENWELRGTEVIVEYRDSLPFFSRFTNPAYDWGDLSTLPPFSLFR